MSTEEGIWMPLDMTAEDPIADARVRIAEHFESEDFFSRLAGIVSEIELGMDCSVYVGADGSRYYFQIQCHRMDTITKQMGLGFGGKAYLSPHMTKSELVQTIFGLYKGYWEHEARETFIYRGRRPFGPHIDTDALWEVARRVDVRSAKHVEDQK